jgi:hypothetical protein
VRLPDGMRAAVADSLASTGRLTRVVNDFLNITAIKPGSNILDLSSCSLKPAIEEILVELRTDIEALGLRVSYPTDDASWPPLKIDCGKVKECLFIVIENAVRYNRRGGSIKISTDISNKDSDQNSDRHSSEDPKHSAAILNSIGASNGGPSDAPTRKYSSSPSRTPASASLPRNRPRSALPSSTAASMPARRTFDRHGHRSVGGQSHRQGASRDILHRIKRQRRRGEGQGGVAGVGTFRSASVN